MVTHPDRNKPIFKPYPKTYASRRTLAISREAMKNLPERGKPDDFVVGGSFMLSYTQVRRMCRRIAKETGFDEEITPRRFRTTLATDIADATHDLHLVQASFGHTTPAMSLKYYVKGRNTSVDAAVALAGVYERPRM